MPSSHHDLAQIQAWLQSVIMNPSGVIGGIESADARAHTDVSPTQPTPVIKPSSH
jgi:hypothetical protein